MTTPDPLAALREAERDKRHNVCQAFDQTLTTLIEEEHGRKPTLGSGECIHAFYDALSELEDAVAARVREEGKEREVELMALAMFALLPNVAAWRDEACTIELWKFAKEPEGYLTAARALRDAFDKGGAT